MRDHSTEVEANFFKSGGQGDLYSVRLDDKPFILKIYRGQREGQLRLRELSDKLDLLPPPKQVERGRMVDCGNVANGTESWPAAIFNRVNGIPLFDPFGSSECSISRGDAPEEVRLKLAEDLLEGVYYLHENGIVHADLSPTNILVDDSATELTIIDIDGAGILDSKINGWKRSPLVLGQARITGFPPPAEFWNDSVAQQTDSWWVSMLTYYLLTSNSPFFFLQEVTPPSLSKLQELFRGDSMQGWPPSYDVASTHYAFRENVTEDDYLAMVRYVNNLIPTNVFFLTFVPGYTNKVVRASPYDLFWELKIRNDSD